MQCSSNMHASESAKVIAATCTDVPRVSTVSANACALLCVLPYCAASRLSPLMS